MKAEVYPKGAACVVVTAVLLLTLVILDPFHPSVEAQSQMVTNPTLAAEPRSPGRNASYTVEFTTNQELPALTGIISLELDYRINLPSSIRGNNVTVRYRKGSEYGSGHAGEVTIQRGRSRNSPSTISITPDVKANDRSIPIPSESQVTVILQTSAGIRNPQEGGAYPWKVYTSEETSPQTANHPEEAVIAAFLNSASGEETSGLLVDREVTLNKQEGGRGEQVSATARGYRPGTAITFWRDANADGRVDQDEREICQAAVSTAGDANCSFRITTPPFAGGYGQCLEAPRTCNLINARDGEGSTAVLIGAGTNRVYRLDNLVELLGIVKASQDPGRGEEINVSLISFPQGTVTEVTVSAIPVELDPRRVGPEGDLDFRVPVPEGVRGGLQQLEVTLRRSDNGQDYTAHTIVEITSGRTEVTAEPGTSPPNGRILVTGIGFRTTEGAHISEIRIAGNQVEIPANGDGQRRIAITATGTFAQVITVPVTRSTMAPGLHELWVTDSTGRTGSTEIRIPERTITLHPEESAPGSILEVKGTGFPAYSASASGARITLSYATGDHVTQAHAETDDQGRFVAQLKVPTQSHPGSANTVTVEYFDDDGSGAIALQASHRVKGPEISLRPDAGPPGTVVTLSGTGFLIFTPVESLSFGNLDVNRRAAVVTDSTGAFTTQFLVPGTDTGLQQVSAVVGGALAAAAFRVTRSDLVEAGSTDLAEELAALSPYLTVIWHFNNDTKRWTFYDGSPDGSLDHLHDGQVYLLQVKGNVSLYLNNRPRQLTCYSGNCWNQIIW